MTQPVQQAIEGLAFTITGRDIWDKLSEIGDSVVGLPAVVTDHEARIRAMEKKIWVAVGFAAALGGGSGAALSQLWGG